MDATVKVWPIVSGALIVVAWLFMVVVEGAVT
jgi:hypothetical protein